MSNGKNLIRKNKKLEYGDADIPDDAFEPKNIKAHISIRLDLDIVEHFKNLAGKSGSYQSLINEVLRDSMEKSKTTLGTENIAKELKDLRKLIEKNLVNSDTKRKKKGA